MDGVLMAGMDRGRSSGALKGKYNRRRPSLR